MKFACCAWEKIVTYVVTGRKRAAAERAVRRERESVALFPELSRETNADNRLASIAEGLQISAGEWRHERARAWRTARRSVCELPGTAGVAVLRYWNEAWTGPRSPEYLATFALEARRGVCFWRRMADLRRLRLIGAGRLPRSFLSRAS